MSSEATLEKAPIDPQDYMRVLQGLTLKNVALVSCKAESERQAVRELMSKTAKLSVSVQDQASFRAESAGLIIVEHNYSITSKSGRKKILSIAASFDVEFEALEGFDAGFFEAFKELSLRLITWPYVRELVASMTSRMDLPRLQLGLWRVPFGRGTAEGEEA